MSVTEENKLLKTIIEIQASRIEGQDATIKELRSMRANLEETLDKFKL